MTDHIPTRADALEEMNAELSELRALIPDDDRLTGKTLTECVAAMAREFVEARCSLANPAKDFEAINYRWAMCFKLATGIETSPQGAMYHANRFAEQRAQDGKYAEDCRALLGAAKCPSNCTSGTTRHGDQCEWCFKRDAALAKNPINGGGPRTAGSDGRLDRMGSDSEVTAPAQHAELTAEQLLPCPFCGSTNIDPEEWASTERTGPGCDDCGACADTIEIWNTRAVVPRVEQKLAPVEYGSYVEALRAAARSYAFDSLIREAFIRELRSLPESLH